MVIGRAMTWLTIHGAHAVPVLGDFERRPVVLRQSRDQTGNYAGLTHAARVSADDDKGHGLRIVVGPWSLAVGRWENLILLVRRTAVSKWPTTKGQRPKTILKNQ